MRFSQRKGFAPIKAVIQKETVDADLRNGLWDALYLYLWCKFNEKGIQLDELGNSNLTGLFWRYWHSYFKTLLETLPWSFSVAKEEIKDYFFKCEWFQLYDFIEFTAQNAPDNLVDEFIHFCNVVLKRELSAYRIIDKQVVEITSEEEIKSIEEALTNSSILQGVNAHLKSALEHLSDRKNPDFRNSMKESISAVESLARLLSNDDKATLGDALKILEKKLKIHPALKASLSSLYGYTCDEDGIRHAMLEEPNLTFNDAKFMLVSCTSFINYLLGKASELGIKIL